MTTFETVQESGDQGDRFDPEIWRKIETMMDAGGMPWNEAVAATTGVWPELPGNNKVAACVSVESELDDDNNHPEYLGKDHEASAGDRVARRPYIPRDPDVDHEQRVRDTCGRALAATALFSSQHARLEGRADRLGVPVGALARAEWERKQRRLRTGR
jgi:hypothetical protein